MPGESLIGNLAILLSMDTAAFEKGATHSQKLLARTQKQFEATGRKIATVGVGLTAAITAPFIGLVAKAVPAAIESQKAIAQVNAALASMGPVAGRTSKQLEDAAEGLQHISTFDDDDILVKVTANLLTFGRVTGDVFDRAQLAAVNLSARLGQDLQSSAIQLGKALNDPIKGLTALSRVGVSFTEQQKKQVKDLVKTNQLHKAQAIILGEVERQFAGAAKAQRDATPGADLIDSWREFEETLGAIALKVLPPLTKFLSQLLEKFNQLSPGMQTFAVGAAAAAAAVGPLLIGVGAMVSGFGRLLPLILPLGAGAAAGATGLAALGAALGPLAIAALAAFIAFKKWDELVPILKRFGEQAGPALAAAEKQLTSLFDAIGQVDRALGTAPDQQFMQGLSTEFVGGLRRVQTELIAFNNAVNAFEAGIIRFARNAWTAFDELWTRAVRAFHNMVTGIQNAVGNRLRAIFDGLKAQVNAVGDVFARLYDRVVGHSYVPDMVDGIAAQMARLDAVMAQPAAAAASKTARAFRDLQQETKAILDRLFPEAMALNTYAAEAKKLEAAMKAGIITAQQYRAALTELDLEGVSFAAPAGQEGNEIELLGGSFSDQIDRIADTLPKLPPLADAANNALMNVAQSGVAMLADGLAAVITGTAKLGDVFRSVAQQIIADLIRIQIQKMLVQALSSLGNALGIPGLGNIFGGARARGGPVVGGKAYLVGENGPELFAPGRSGRVIANDDMPMGRGGAGHLHVHFGFPVSKQQARQTAGQAESARRQRLGVNARRGVAG